MSYRGFPGLFVPCISINPKRRDAIDELERWADQGVRILKIHPPIQDVDPGESRFRLFCRTCARRGVIVMVHTGTEHSAEIVGHDYSQPQRLVIALEEGCTVVAAHSGMSAFFDREEFFPQLVALVRRFPNLDCDTAVLGDKFRWRNLPRLTSTAEVLERTIYASDIPFPSNALVLWNRLRPVELLSLLSETNLFDRNYRLGQALGLPPEVFEGVPGSYRLPVSTWNGDENPQRTLAEIFGFEGSAGCLIVAQILLSQLGSDGKMRIHHVGNFILDNVSEQQAGGAFVEPVIVHEPALKLRCGVL